MKITAPSDLHGRMISLEQRLTMLQFSLDSIANAYDARRTIRRCHARFADAVEQVRDEVRAIAEDYVAERNAEYCARLEAPILRIVRSSR
jgi:hypothetical protein